MARVLLVLGNGFDLNCGLKSSFKQYLSSNFYAPYLDTLAKIDRNLPHLYLSTAYNINFGSLNFWDIYYGLAHYYELNNIDSWYDFETKLNKFVQDYYNNDAQNPFSYLYNTFGNHNITTDSQLKYEFTLYKYYEQNNMNESLLYSQLKEYEKRFGSYIVEQQKNSAEYIENAKKLITNLLDKTNDDEVKYINNFNYTNLSDINPNIWHINGDSDNPIFGIDIGGIGPLDDVYKYTKTYRRLELFGKKIYAPKNTKYNKVIVFGHSLNPQDYSYFYSLFNILDLSNNRYYSNNTDRYIEFAYCKHSGMTSETARRDIVSRTLKLFYQYNTEILKENNFRLIDILFSAGAIRFKEIDPDRKIGGTVVAS